MLAWLRSLARAILGQTGKPDRPDTATRMAVDADFSVARKTAPTANERAQQVDQINELMRIVGVQGKEPPTRGPKVLAIPRRRKGR